MGEEVQVFWKRKAEEEKHLNLVGMVAKVNPLVVEESLPLLAAEVRVEIPLKVVMKLVVMVLKE